jgi:hypothetical protein
VVRGPAGTRGPLCAPHVLLRREWKETTSACGNFRPFRRQEYGHQRRRRLSLGQKTARTYVRYASRYCVQRRIEFPSGLLRTYVYVHVVRHTRCSATDRARSRSDKTNNNLSSPAVVTASYYTHACSSVHLFCGPSDRIGSSLSEDVPALS